MSSRRHTCNVCRKPLRGAEAVGKCGGKAGYCPPCYALILHLGKVHRGEVTPRFDPLPELRAKRVERHRKRQEAMR